jgi:hypothetical protein
LVVAGHLTEALSGPVPREPTFKIYYRSNNNWRFLKFNILEQKIRQDSVSRRISIRTPVARALSPLQSSKTSSKTTSPHLLNHSTWPTIAQRVSVHRSVASSV